MAFPTPVNDQITDSITQANVLVLGLAPAIAMGMFYQVTSQALGNAANNATLAQQEGYTLYTAVTAFGCARIYGLKPAS